MSYWLCVNIILPEKAGYFYTNTFLFEGVHQSVRPLLIEAIPMAEKKKDQKKPTKHTYNGKTYKIMEESETMLKLTDGKIHFWIKKDVE